MHAQEWCWVEKLFGCFFLFFSLSSLFSWLGFWVFTHEKTKHRKCAVSQRTSPLAFAVLTWLWVQNSVSLHMVLWFWWLRSVLLCRKATLLWLRVLHHWPCWRNTQLLRHGSRNCDCVWLMSNLMTLHYGAYDAICTSPLGHPLMFFFSQPFFPLQPRSELLSAFQSTNLSSIVSYYHMPNTNLLSLSLSLPPSQVTSVNIFHSLSLL